MTAARLVSLGMCLAAVSVCMGCSEEDDLSLTPVCITFTPNAPTSTPIAVANPGPGTTCNKVDLVIVANQDLTNVFSMSLDFRYPLVGVLDFDSIEPAAIWTEGGFTIIEQYDEEPAGVVTLAISRVNPTPGVPGTGFDILAGQPLATFSLFQTAGSGGGSLTFVSGALLTGNIPPVTIAEVPDDPSPNIEGTVVGQLSIMEQ